MLEYLVRPSDGPLRGVVRVPADRIIGHRALILAALADGTSTLRRFSFSEDQLVTLSALQSLGVAHEVLERSEGPKGGRVRVHGVGLFALKSPIDGRPLDCRASDTSTALLTALLSAQPFESVVLAANATKAAPAGVPSILELLRHRGAALTERGHGAETSTPLGGLDAASLHIGPLSDAQNLAGLEVSLPTANALVKSALLLSGLYANGPTVISEPTLSNDHTERMMEMLGVPLQRLGSWVALDPAGWSGELAPFEFDVPGDLSAAAYLVVAANIVANSVVRVVEVGVNPTRTGALDVLRAMGGGAHVVSRGTVSKEPMANLEIGMEVGGSGRGLTATAIGGELVPRAIEELPLLCVAAALAHGTTTLRDAGELRGVTPDSLGAMASMLASFGVQTRRLPDGLVIVGRPEGKLRAATVDAQGDHRIAMSAALLALRADGPSHIVDVATPSSSFPGFARTLRDLGADIVENVVPSTLSPELHDVEAVR